MVMSLNQAAVGASMVYISTTACTMRPECPACPECPECPVCLECPVCPACPECPEYPARLSGLSRNPLCPESNLNFKS